MENKTPTHKIISSIITLIILALIIIFANARKLAPVQFGFWGDVNIQEDLALEGYDTVSYFQENGPTQGFEEFSTIHNGAQWNFSSEENKNLFLSDPEKYSPEYGGYCAEAVRVGFTTVIDPEYWLMIGSKLYLFKGQKSLDVFERKLEKGAIEKSDRHWDDFGEWNPNN